MRVLVVKFQLKPEFRERFLQAALDDAYGANHNEPNCLRFDVIQDEADPNRIYFYEVYKDEAAFQEHLKTPHYLKYRDAISDAWYARPAEIGRGWSLYPPDAEWR
jgi:autoinducer 2-degrading protein